MNNNDYENDKTIDIISIGNNLNVSNTILHYACLEYMKLFGTKLIPFDYIEYYIKQIGTYDKYFETDLRTFYNSFDDISSLNIGVLATIYSKDISTVAVAIVEKDSIEFIISDEDPIDMLSFYMENETRDTVTRRIYNNFKIILDEIEKLDELVSKKNLFEKYMIDKFLADYEPKNIIRKAPKQEEQTKVETIANKEKADEQARNEQLLELDTSLKGKESEVPEEKGKVVRLYIPKLLLPSPYPVLQDTSRINSEYHASKIIYADKTLNLFNHYKFKQVIYKKGFIEKRKKVKKPKPKFSFDF